MMVVLTTQYIVTMLVLLCVVSIFGDDSSILRCDSINCDKPLNHVTSHEKPTLKEFISNTHELKTLPDHDTLYTTLTAQLGITEIDSLIFIYENDLNDLCRELDLSFGDKVIFKAAINKLQYTYKPTQALITISANERSQIDKVKAAIKQSNAIQNILQKHLNDIDEDIAAIKSQISTQIGNVIKTLQDREKFLHDQLEQWKLERIKNVTHENENIIEYHNTLTTTMKIINDSLRMTESVDREERLQQIVDNVFENNANYKQYQESGLLTQFLLNNTILIAVEFEEAMNMFELAKYGQLQHKKETNFRLKNFFLSTEEQIPLKIHSHKGHHGDYGPERMLQTNDDYYLSTEHGNDWIIFEILIIDVNK